MVASTCEALLALVLRGAATSEVPPWTAVTDPGLRAVVDAVASESGRPAVDDRTPSSLRRVKA
jgi:AraC family transcriptional regulator, activator of mtrCDE